MQTQSKGWILAAVIVLLGAGACSAGSLDGSDGVPSSDDAGTTTDPTSDGGVNSCECNGCTQLSVGIGADRPFDPSSDESEFVDLDATGALVVDKRNSKYNRFMWVADTNLPGVVKIDLQTLAVVARYRTGGSSTSRTTVNARGEAFIASRSNGNGSAGVTKILPDGEDCPDTNGDGVVTTSTGPADVLAWGQDDCVAWHTATNGDIRGLAAQDIPGVDPNAMCTGGDDTPIDQPDEHWVWAGGMHGTIYKIDADTGAIVLQIDAPSSVYGMALAGDGKLWTGQGLAFVDTLQCTEQTACAAAPVCQQSCSTTTCPDTCDDAIKGRIQGVSGYGITVDCKNRVWLSSGDTTRYDPTAPVNARLAEGPGSGSGGIAADANGWVWASNGNSTTRIDAETLAGTTIAAPSKGVAVDSEGRVLTVQNDSVHLIEPGGTLDDYTLTNDVVALEGFAYAYSDMTGIQTRLASDEPGWYRHVFEGCDEDAADTTDWRTLEWDVEAPEGTWTAFNARTADSLDGLADAPWWPVVSCAAGNDCMNLQEGGRYLEIEARLTATGESDDGVRGCTYDPSESARIKRIDVFFTCAGVIE